MLIDEIFRLYDLSKRIYKMNKIREIMNKKRFMLAILLISVLCLGSSAVFAEDAENIADSDIMAVDNNVVYSSSNHTISSGSTSDQIQDTINNMNDGDELNFESGTYSDICIYVNKSITINGNGATLIGYDTPSINNTPSIITNKTADGGFGISNLATLYVVNANNVTIKGLNIVGGANSASTYSNTLVFVTNSHNMTFIDNTIDGSSWGIYIQYSHDGVYTDNLIRNQAVTGLINFGSARTIIERNKVINAKNHGIDVRHGTGPNVQVINNTVVGSQEGIYLMHSKGHTAANNTLINCSISSISCYGSSNINLYNNTLQKSRIGILLGGGYQNITVGANDFQLNNLPYPPTFVYYIAEAQTDYGSATKMMGTHSDSSSYTPTYTAYTEIPTPKEINIDYTAILSETGTVYNVPEGTSSSDIQKIIDSMKDGDTLKFEKNAVYNNISIYTDKNIKIFGNGATLIGYDNLDLTNIPSKITATTADGGYALSNPAVLYSVNNTGVVIADLNIVSKYPGYEPLATVPGTSVAYKTVGIRTYESKNITITGCTIDGASWGIYLEYSGIAIVTNNEIKNQFTTGILNFGTPESIIAENTITNVANHGIDVRHGTGPRVTVFNNTIIGAREGIYLMHSQGHNVYNNTVKDCSISGITAYGSGNEKIFNNNISGSRIGILLGGGYYNVTIGTNTYDLDSLPFPPTFATYLAKAESKNYGAENAQGTYTTLFDTVIDAKDIETLSSNVTFELTLTTAGGKAIENQTVIITINNITYERITDADGIATVNVTLAVGKYDVSIDYAGEGTYVKTKATSTISVGILKPTNNTLEAVQAAVDSANAGNIVDLSSFDEYDFGNGTLIIAKDEISLVGDGSTTIYGHGIGNGLVHVKGSNVAVALINFVDTNPNKNFTYGGTTAGNGVNFQGVTGGLLTGCSFTDFNSAVVVQGSTDVIIENSNFTGGYTTVIANDPTVNVEKGSKSLNIYRQSSKITVRGNTFEGPILDAVSIAQGSGSNIVENNTFIGNTYSIYFGGSSTKNSVIRNNTFILCGEFKRDGQSWDRLPVISIQKASNDIAIENNNFTAVENNILIAAEQGNEAHGFPSSLGNINVTGNIVDTSMVDNASAVVLFHILVREGELNLSAPLKVEDNTLNGATENVTWLLKNGNEYALKPTTNTLEAVQAAVDMANPGDMVDLTLFDEYDFGNGTLTIAKDNITLISNGNATIKGDGAGNGLVYVTGSNVIIQGIQFVDTNDANNFTYGGSTNGWGVNFRSVTGGLVTDCMFTDFGSAVVVQGSTDVIIENSNFTGGYTTVIANDPTVNVEKGSKSLNIYRQSSKITVRGNTFEGPILDAVSIAQGSGSNIVEDNIFIGNTYSIYFGGSSTKNSVIRNNTFIDCGQFIADDQYWDRLPVISIQKASNDIAIEDNTFVAVENNILIAAEQGNEAHGFPSSLGNINVTGNIVDTSNVVDPAEVVLFHVLVREGELNLSAPIKLEDNTLNGATENITWLLSQGNEYVLEPTSGTFEAVQYLVDAANDGDTIDLSRFYEYDFGNSTLNIAKNNINLVGNGFTTIYGDGVGNGLVYVTGSNVTVALINFVDTNDANNFTYGGSTNGWGVNFRSVTGGLVTDCMFTDFGSAVVVQGSTDVIIENSNFTGGYTTVIANDPTVNVEKGSKSLNIYRQSSKITVRGNTFEGPILDAVSIAQGSGSNIVENNTFIGNTYSIYFGGSSTKNSVIRNNTFINCGEFKRDNQFWERLPVISIQKASNDIAIEDNTFVAVENSVLIAAEQGNEAHGFPSSLGNINVTGNIVNTDNVDNASAVVLFHVLVREGELNLSAPLKVEDNTLNGATEDKYWNLSAGNEYALKPTSNTAEALQAAIDAANPGDVIDLSSFDEYDLGDENVLIDKNITIVGTNNTVIKGNGSILKARDVNVTVENITDIEIKDEPLTTSIAVSDVTVTAGDSGSLQITLKDIGGNLLSGKIISVTVNTETTNLTTDNGVATFTFKFDSANVYFADISFVGNEDYKSASATAKITVNEKVTPVTPETPITPTVTKKTTKITAAKKTFKAKTKTKKYTITLKSGKAAVKKVRVTLKVGKKTYKATTNSKGKATFKITKLTKKGKYTAKITFAGNSAYKATSKKVKITVKK